MAKSQNWQKTAIAAAATAFLTLTATGAMALSLGRITVQSALGEPLRAEIEVPVINAEELASLRTAVALPDAFVAAGLEYNPALSSLQAVLQRRPDGRAYIRLTSDRPINDPFVDMILEASWSSGRIVRDYTMLFDPPSLRKPAQVTPTLPQVAPPVVTRPAQTPTPSAEATRPAAQPSPSGQIAVAKPARTIPKPSNTGEKKVTVNPGDTATKIAVGIKETGVSLDQMLVAMLRSNPDAFINNNIDRIRSGAVINVPSSEQAKSVSAPEASRILRAESKDFQGFKRALASNAPTTTVAAADRKTSGTIESKVVESKPKAATPDKLTLSKGAVQAKNDEAKLAQERADKDAATRAAELSKNISDLKKASDAVASASAPATATPAAKPEPAAVASAPVAPAATVTTPDAVVPTPAVAASTPANTTVAPAPKPVAAVPIEEPGLIDSMIEEPLLPAAGLGLLALLGGFGFYQMRKRKQNAAQVDSSFLESRLQPDSFFGASGGQRVDTNSSEGPVSGSSMVYSASQLDAADDVDPVAEADVYLAYGRDLQAEEILKEAVRTNPGRLAIYTKLLEIFAKRRDAASYEATAAQAYKLTGSDSADWTRICEMGLGFDPTNTLYLPGGAPESNSAPSFTTTVSSGSGYSASTVPQAAHPELAQGNGVDLDLDLDFSLDDEPASAISDVTGGTMSKAEDLNSFSDQTIKMEAPAANDFESLDFDISGPTPIAPEPEMPSLPEASIDMDAMNFDLPTAPSLPEFSATDTMPVEPSTVSDGLKDSGMLEFDMGSLSLDLDPPAASEPVTEADTLGEDPLETKLALAEEFVSFGDDDGARALIEEVVAEATGEMRIKAQRALANLS